MRVIKFRGIQFDTLEWIYGDHHIYSCAKGYVFISNEEGTFQVIPESVGQFTGLIDKNDIEIYEDDILDMYDISFDHAKAIKKQMNCVVKFNDGEFRARHQSLRQFYTCDIKVIGNIHDNTLLEIKK